METEAIKKREKIQSLEPQSLLQAAIEKGASVETLERLVALAKDVRAEQAKAAYYEAKAEFQRLCPPISKSKKARIATRSGGGYEYSYAPLDAIMEKIGPVLGNLGLSIKYRISQTKDSVTAVCCLAHEVGYQEESGEITMPIVIAKSQDGNYIGANPAQCVGIATTYAKRYALLAITGAAPQGDDVDGHHKETKPEKQSRPLVKKQEEPEETTEEIFDLTPEEQEPENIVHCTITQVEPRKDKKQKAYAYITSSAGIFYCWDEKLFSACASGEGQRVRIEFDPKESGGKTYRYVKALSIETPEAR